MSFASASCLTPVAPIALTLACERPRPPPPTGKFASGCQCLKHFGGLDEICFSAHSELRKLIHTVTADDKKAETARRSNAFVASSTFFWITQMKLLAAASMERSKADW